MTHYKVEISFPDGHIQEFEEVFHKKEAAIDFAAGVLAQVSVTERYHHRKNRDDFDFEEPTKPYFFVYQIEGFERELVFDSRKDK